MSSSENLTLQISNMKQKYEIVNSQMGGKSSLQASWSMFTLYLSYHKLTTLA